MRVNDSKRENLRRMAVRFEGHVQGVGFRYTAVTVASRYEVVGFVRNESDGSVSVVAEGEQGTLTDFLNALRRSPVGRYVTRDDVSWGDATGEYGSFGVRYER